MTMSTTKPHILLLGLGLFDDAVGGISAYQTNLVRQLIRQGYQVSVMIPRTRPGLPARTTQEGVTIYRYGSARGGWLSLLEQQTDARQCFRQIHAAQAIDILSVHFALSAWGILHLPEIKPLRKIMHYHGPWPLEWQAEKASLGILSKITRQIQHRIEKTVVQEMDHLVLNSQAFVPYVKETYTVPDQRIHVVPIGWDTEAIIPVEESRAVCRQELGIPPATKMLFTARRLVKRTGVDMLLQAVAPLMETYPDLALYIAGTGPEGEGLQRLSQHLQITDRTHFLGFVPDPLLHRYYRAADVTCMPTRSLEGFGTSILESLVQGTPVMATPIGGMPEILGALSPRLLTESATPEALSATIRSWLTGDLMLPDEYTCRQYVAQSFHWDTLFPQIERLYQTEHAYDCAIGTH